MTFLERIAAPFVVVCLMVGTVRGQEASNWRASASSADRYGSNDATDNRGLSAAGGATTPAPDSRIAPVGAGPTRARVTKGTAALPHDHGQVWREYDIRPYTMRVDNTNRPEQTIIDWILRETGYEAWHSEPLGLLSANRETLTVYHTPEMQAVVADIVDRFVNSQAARHAFSLRVATVQNPNWRARALPLMTPISVQSPGIQGWLLAREDYALLISELTRRTDYREYNSTQQLVTNGQSIVLSTMRPRPYMKGIIPTAAIWPGYQMEMGQLEEGFTLEFSPLLSLDLASTNAIVKLRLNQVEQMVPVKLDLPTMVSPNQRVEVEVPQMTMANLHERFHWPTDKVLLLSMGVVATPGAGKANPIMGMMPGMQSPPRADALLFVESKGSVVPAAAPDSPVSTAAAPQQSFHGRY